MSRIVAAALLLLLAGCLAVRGAEGREVLAEVGPKRVESWGNYPGHVSHPRHTVLATLDSGVERYGLRYSCCPHPSHAPGVATPEGYIGMPLPSSANWYHNGFLRIYVNGSDVGTTPLAALRRAETGRRGSVQLVWRGADAHVHATFLMLPQDPTLYLEVAAYPKGELHALEVQLTAYPVAYRSDVDRWVVTPRRGIQQERRESLDPAAEPWLLCQDHTLARTSEDSPHLGGCGLQFLPEEVGAAEGHVQRYSIHIRVRAKPGLRRLHLAIWDFHDKTDREAEQFVRSRAKQTAASLGSLDFTNPILRGEGWPELRARLVELLPAAKGHPELHGKVERAVERVDELLVEAQRARAKGEAPLPEVEDALVEALETLRERRWEIEFVALFAE